MIQFSLKQIRARHQCVPPTPIDELRSRAAVAKQLSVCQHTLRSWERRGKGPPTLRVGRRVYYRLSAVHGWLLDQEAKNSSK